MTTPTLRQNILQALANSSSQMPVTLTGLKALLAPKVKMADLVSEVDLLCKNRELQTCSGIKDGKEYVSYWISGTMTSSWNRPRKETDARKKPATALPAKQKNG